MFHGFSVSFNPVEPKLLFVTAAVAVVILTVWAYARKLRGSTGGWRWVALGLRLTAILLCLLAALRPSVVLQEKKRQAADLVFLIDSSKSMALGDEIRGQTRWAVGKQAMEEGMEAARGLGPNLDVVPLRFDSSLADALTEGKLPAEPSGSETQLGTAMLEAEKRASQDGKRIARMIVISDFVSNSGTNPLVVARTLRDHQVPVVTVGLGAENAGKQSRDIAVRDIVAAPTVFVKNQLEVRGTLVSRGYPGQPVKVDLYVEGQTAPVASTQVKVPDGAESAPIAGLKYVPQTPGEKLISLKVTPLDGEFITSNNDISTFVTVLSGGLNVMFLQGPNFTWDYRYLLRSTMTSQVIQVEGFVIRKPVQGDASEVDDAEFAPGKYNVYVLSDLPANFLPPRQHRLLAEAVKKGAGLMMLGGRTSFGAGGWAETALTDVLPVEIHPGDGQLEPEGGVKFVPSNTGLNSYLLQIGASKEETAKLWEMMPPVLGTNRFSGPKGGAEILAQTGGAVVEPLLVTAQVGSGRVVAYGGDTWVWPRSSEEGRLAHRKFWRNVIFWLSHKENEGDTQVKLALDRRRIGVGQKVEMTVTARDAKGANLSGVTYETKVEREGLSPTPEPVDLYTQGDEARGSYAAVGQPGAYKVTVIGRKDGHEIGRDSSRFLVYQDDRELENQSADLALARQIAEITGGESIPRETLAKYLKSIDQSQFTEYLSPTEHKVWDNWPFLLIFTAILTLEWWIRKRHGWV
ncbi:glutamine amidotransferase [Aquisphaera insulae]|uniref:glutamine amidotransferase n=1 Tax=Aquisphaera insulae TaxID=2712864 RepID=UPI0013EA0F7B|nr:glutamine amidotransferase [Aquisphaera insulae]